MGAILGHGGSFLKPYEQRNIAAYSHRLVLEFSR
jgi:hypothetical protein